MSRLSLAPGEKDGTALGALRLAVISETFGALTKIFTEERLESGGMDAQKPKTATGQIKKSCRPGL